MPKLNIDEQTKVFEPIEITLEGKTYVIEKITDDMMIEVVNMSKGEGANDVRTVKKQLAFLLNTDEKSFKGVDLRKLGKAVQFITSTITEQLSGDIKND